MRPNALARPEQTSSPAIHQLAADAGRSGVAAWLTQNKLTLAQCRDQQRASFLLALGCSQTPEFLTLCQGFDEGFSAGLAAFIAGARHD
ncbi:hypothetical protein [Achromobacter veterisilvae]|uniref:hypothetical protein n=1 Tax=Achromobacter veterisilvae TaxID=2069367 RepID=UPI00100E027A|nr:hypothetical protein [Achromobacter veterisilvae]